MFDSYTSCSEYLGLKYTISKREIESQNPIQNKYYVSDKLMDEFIIKPRRQYLKQTFYVYTVDKVFVGKYIGKEIMKVINLHSWDKISHIFIKNNNWYKDFYVSLENIDASTVPSKKYSNGIAIDIYDKYGTFIETLKTIKEVKEKYNVPAAKLKNIQLGNKYFGDYIFKYNK